MKRAALIVWKVERVFAIIGLVAVVMSVVGFAICGAVWLDTLFEAVKQHPENFPAWLTKDLTEDAFKIAYWTFVCTYGFILIPIMIAEVVVCHIGINKLENAKNKNEMITLGVLNCIFGWKVPGIFIFVSRTHEWNSVEEKPEY